MIFTDVKPYIRYARFLTIDNIAQYPAFVPYDARFFFVVDGCGEIVVNGKVYTLERSDMLLINAGNEYYHKPPKEKITYIVFNFDYTFNNADVIVPISPDVKAEFNKDKLIEKVKIEEFGVFNEVIYIKKMSAIESRVVAIRKEYAKKLLYHEQRESCLFTEVLIEIVRKKNFISTDRSEDMTDKIIDYIQANCAKKITNKEIGEKFGFHPNYISSLIKKTTGLPLHKYIMNARISYAMGLLEAGGLSVAQIARECGFCDACYFTKCFKKIVGVLPTEYKWL